MHVLVIGGTRFVGYFLTWRLIAQGHKITLLNRGKIPDPFGDRVERLKGDRSTPAFKKLLGGRKFDAVVDFAAYTAADVRGVIETLSKGRAGHYVFLSTGQVYLVREACPRPAKETDFVGALIPEPKSEPEHEEWLYGVGKREAEDILHQAWRTDGFPSTRIRVPMVNGERDHFRRIEGYLRRLLDGGPILLPGKGEEVCRHVYGQDVARTIADLIGKREAFGEFFNLSQDEEPKLRELVGVLAEMLGARAQLMPIPVEKLIEHGLEPTQVSPFSTPWMSHLDPSKAKSEIGFRHTPLREYLGHIVSSFLTHPPSSVPVGYKRRAEEFSLLK